MCNKPVENYGLIWKEIAYINNLNKIYDTGYISNLNSVADRWFNSYRKGLTEGQFKEFKRNCKSYDVDIEDVLETLNNRL